MRRADAIRRRSQQPRRHTRRLTPHPYPLSRGRPARRAERRPARAAPEGVRRVVRAFECASHENFRDNCSAFAHRARRREVVERETTSARAPRRRRRSRGARLALATASRRRHSVATTRRRRPCIRYRVREALGVELRRTRRTQNREFDNGRRRTRAPMPSSSRARAALRPTALAATTRPRRDGVAHAPGRAHARRVTSRGLSCDDGHEARGVSFQPAGRARRARRRASAIGRRDARHVDPF